MQRIAGRLAPALALWATTACQTVERDPTEISQPVVGAIPTTGDPGVVALVNSRGDIFCTGTLVSPSVVVTAAHCLDEGGANPSAFFGSDTLASGLTIGVCNTRPHPQWNGNLGNGHDVGVMLLSQPQDPTLVVPLNTTPLDPSYLGADYRVVGFGIHDVVTREIDGKKRTGTMQISQLTDGSDYLEASDDATVICQGDSGGPGFLVIDGGEKLAGIHSYSIEGCSNPSGDTRVDVFAESFIKPYIEENDPACGPDGTCAPIGCNDDPDCQPCGGDGTCTADCPEPDIDCPTQALGEMCRANSQCMSDLCVAYADDPETKFCSTRCQGDAQCPEGTFCRSIQPFGNVCYYAGSTKPPGALGQECTVGADCAQGLCDETDHVCTRSCAATGSSATCGGSACPTSFACEDHGAGLRCFEEKSSSGGCSSSSGTTWWFAALLALACSVRRCGGRSRAGSLRAAGARPDATRDAAPRR